MDVKSREYIAFGKHDKIGLEIEKKGQECRQHNNQHRDIPMAKYDSQKGIVDLSKRAKYINTSFNTIFCGALRRQIDNVGGEHEKDLKK